MTRFTSVPAGIEAPIRIYVTEDADGKVGVTYRTPSALFAPYGNAQLDTMARELDPIFDKVVRDAVTKERGPCDTKWAGVTLDGVPASSYGNLNATELSP